MARLTEIDKITTIQIKKKPINEKEQASFYCGVVKKLMP
jgi:hypothetical protein